MPPSTLRPLRRGSGYPSRRAPQLTHRQQLRRWLAGTSPLDRQQVEQGRRMLRHWGELGLRPNPADYTPAALRALRAAYVWHAHEWAASVNEPWRFVATDPFPLPEPADVAAFRRRLWEKSARVCASFALAPPPLVPWGDLAPAYEAHMVPLREAAAQQEAQRVARLDRQRERQRAKEDSAAAGRLRALLLPAGAARVRLHQEEAVQEEEALEAALLGLGDVLDGEQLALAALFR